MESIHKHCKLQQWLVTLQVGDVIAGLLAGSYSTPYVHTHRDDVLAKNATRYTKKQKNGFVLHKTF